MQSEPAPHQSLTATTSNNSNVSPSLLPASSSPVPLLTGDDPRNVSGNGFNRFDPKYISIGPKATRNPLGQMPSASVNKCATLRHGGRYGNSASKFGSLRGNPQAPPVVAVNGPVKNPQPPTVSTVSKEFGSFGSATLDRRSTSTFSGGGLSSNSSNNNNNASGMDEGRHREKTQQAPQLQSMFTVEGSASTFGRPMSNSSNNNKSPSDGAMLGNSVMQKPISILNQPLPDIPQSAIVKSVDVPPPLPAANTNQPLSAANLSHYQMGNNSNNMQPQKSSFSMTSQLLQSAGQHPVTANNYPLKSSMKQQQQQGQPPMSNNSRPSIQQAPLPPPPVQQPKPQQQQMFSSINATKALPPQLPPKNRIKETGPQQMMQQQSRQTLPSASAKAQSAAAQFNKANPQYATFMGYSENNNNKVVDSGDKARLIQQYYQETSNMRNNNNNNNGHAQQSAQQVDMYGWTVKQAASGGSAQRMPPPPQYSYQTLPHQPKGSHQQQQQQMMAQHYAGQYSGGQQQPQQVHPSYNTMGKGSSAGTQVRHGGGGAGGGGKVDRNSNIEQMTYYRSLQRGSGSRGEAGSANNDLYSVRKGF